MTLKSVPTHFLILHISSIFALTVWARRWQVALVRSLRCSRVARPGLTLRNSYLYNWLAKPIAGGTLAENQAAASHGGAEAPPLGPAPAGLNVRECGSGVGMVML